MRERERDFKQYSSVALPQHERGAEGSMHRTVDFQNLIVLSLGRDPGTLKSDIVSKKHPQIICSDLRLSN